MVPTTNPTSLHRPARSPAPAPVPGSPGRRRRWLGAAASLLLTGACEPAPGRDPAFDWFSYAGFDRVYERRPAGPGEYVNPILAGFHPDPSIVRVGEDYYLAVSSFSFWPGVPIYHSRDLVRWTRIGAALDRPSQLDLDGQGVSRGIFAPTLRWHDGTFYLITTQVDRGGTLLVTASDPAGPWSDPVWLPEVDGIDPSLFFDDDGRAWVINNGPPVGRPRYDGHRALWIQELDLTTMRMVGPRAVVVDGGVDIRKRPIWIEGPHIFKVDGRYVLIAAEGGTAEGHSEVVFRSDAVTGPYAPGPANPILTQRHLRPDRPFPVTSTGHADLVQTPAGDWWGVFLGVRPYGDDDFNTGRETFLLPVTWTDGWPTFPGGTEPLPFVHAEPSLPAGPEPAVPQSGNFSWRDDFDEAALDPEWTTLRTPREDPWLELRDGRLTVRARPEALDGMGRPSFVARRQQHAFAEIATAMRYAPLQPGDQAGLAAFQNGSWYLLSVTLGDAGAEVRLERHVGEGPGGTTEVLATAPAPEGGDTRLRIVARGALYDFWYAARDGDWTLLAGDQDGTVLSTKRAGGFVGTFVGLYAHTAG